MIEKFIVSRDDSIYQAWPDVALLESGKMVCVFSTCTHHFNRAFTQIVCVESDDRGRTWSEKRKISEPLIKRDVSEPNWNCPRITALKDGRLAVVCDRVAGGHEGADGEQSNWLWFSDDEGQTWSEPVATPVQGIVPDQLLELKLKPQAGRWMLAAHKAELQDDGSRLWKERAWYSDDQGQSWEGPFVVAAEKDLMLCEGSIVEMNTGELVCLMRENSARGLDVYRTISRDGGKTWGDLATLPLSGCHRPVAGVLKSGHVLVTYRYLQGGQGMIGWGAQNMFAAIMDRASCLAPDRQQAKCRIMPLDFDRSEHADLGYTGHVQFPDGEIYVVNYINDDAPKGHIRGYSFRESDVILPG
ncbi:MAG: sialidase family protein [Phycisphaeraceae bacterium JB051]